MRFMLRIFGSPRPVDRACSFLFLFLASIVLVAIMMSLNTASSTFPSSVVQTRLRQDPIPDHVLNMNDPRVKTTDNPTVEAVTGSAGPLSSTSSTDMCLLDKEYKIVGDNLRVPRGKEDNLLFLKTHKCGTSSIVNLFYVYGMKRKLNFVTNPWSRQLDIEKTLLPPRPEQHYNIQIAHAKFKPDFQHEILPKNRTFYTTIIRSPIHRFVSAFSYFGKDKENRYDAAGNLLSLDESILSFFSKNEARYAPIKDNCTVEYVVNGLARDLGFGPFLLDGRDLQLKIEDFVSMLDQEFDFVLLTDYFDECLVLLKEQMGWEYSDIFYFKRFYTVDRSRKDSELSQKTVDLIYKYNLVDVQLYNFFYQLYRKKVRAFGEELLKMKTAAFRKMREEFESKCFNKPSDEGLAVKFNRKWEITDFGKSKPSCTFLHTADIMLDFLISEIQTKSDFTAPDGDELMEKWKSSKKIKPMSDETKDMILGLQTNYRRIQAKKQELKEFQDGSGK